eukprot:TRINITY_DN6508_c0_g1_i2.p1 TRINITY_DN6508_c0_g1~~TRINITY_DN6508_c0_g1_i2.p1  ORF type:complete len:173 (+),score=20.43 TRINITY_DN6508_c0_g1_i2:209-727(+)
MGSAELVEIESALEDLSPDERLAIEALADAGLTFNEEEGFDLDDLDLDKLKAALQRGLSKEIDLPKNDDRSESARAKLVEAEMALLEAHRTVAVLKAQELVHPPPSGSSANSPSPSPRPSSGASSPSSAVQQSPGSKRSGVSKFSKMQLLASRLRRHVSMPSTTEKYQAERK